MAKDKDKKSGKRSEKGTAFRSAETGKFVSKEFAQKHPKTTIRETASKKASPSSKRGGSRSGGPKKA